MSDIAGQAADAAAGTSDSVGNAAVGNESAPTPTDNGGQASSEPSVNPAWNEVLQLIPTSLHEGVVPHLQKWDNNFKSKLSEVQSQYAPFDAFKDTPPEQLEQAMNFYRVMESNPEAVYQEMEKFYGFGGGDQGQQEQVDDGEGEETYDLDSDDISQDPRFKELLQNQEVMAQFLVQQQEQERMQELQQSIDTEVSQIQEANPEFGDQDLTLMYNIAASSNISLTDAAKQIKSYREQVAQQTAAPRAPSVMGAGGYVPAAENVDPATLDSKGTRNLVTEILRQSKNG